MQAVRRVLPVLMVLGVALLALQRSQVITNLEDLAVVERSLMRLRDVVGVRPGSESRMARGSSIASH